MESSQSSRSITDASQSPALDGALIRRISAMLMVFGFEQIRGIDFRAPVVSFTLLSSSWSTFLNEAEGV
jgi:hypothetical protein